MAIGKTDWRIVVEERPGQNVTLYEWRDVLGNWCSQRDWHRYDSNAPDLGLPASLAKLHQANRIALAPLLGQSVEQLTGGQSELAF